MERMLKRKLCIVSMSLLWLVMLFVIITTKPSFIMENVLWGMGCIFLLTAGITETWLSRLEKGHSSGMEGTEWDGKLQDGQTHPGTDNDAG